MHALVFVVVVSAILMLFAQPTFVSFDRRLTRRRLFEHPAIDGSISNETSDSHVIASRAHARHRTADVPPNFLDTSACLDDIARRLRRGEAPVDALVDAVLSHDALRNSCGTAIRDARHTGELRLVAADIMSSSTGAVRQFAQAVWISQSGGTLSIGGLERAAIAHRDRWVMLEEKKSASAANRYSMNALTFMPIASLVLSPIWGGASASIITQSAATVVVTIVGVALNAAGFIWCRRISRSVA